MQRMQFGHVFFLAISADQASSLIYSQSSPDDDIEYYKIVAEISALV